LAVPGSFDRLSPYIGQALSMSETALAESYRPARESDLEQILALRSTINGSMWWDDCAFVKWRYFSRRTEAGAIPYWVFVRDGEVVGACGLEPVTIAIDGHPVQATRTLDIMVRPDLDGLGLGVYMNLQLFRHFPITIVTGSNARSHHLLTRMFHYTTDLRFWKSAIRARAVIDQKLRLGPISHLAASVADLFLAAKRLRRVETPPGIVIREIAAFDEQVDGLSRQCERPDRILVRRSASYLNWRFTENSRCRHRILAAFSGDRLMGYVVIRLNVTRPNPRREAEIVDWLTPLPAAQSPSILAALMQAGADALAREGAGVVSCAAAGADMHSAMRAAGFSFRPAERIPFFVRAADPSVHARLCSGESWYLTRGDIDVE
jgi:hypothetical protein